MRRSSPRRATDADARRARRRRWSAAPGPANRPRRVVAAEERGREVEHVAVDEAGARWKAWATVAPPSTSTCRWPLAPELVEQLAEVAVDARGTGGPWRPAGRVRARRAAGRLWAPAASRTVRLGSSARTVPAPTMMASLSARRRWASARASGPVIHWLEPSGAAVRPSSEAASFSTTNGRPVRRWLRYGASRLAAAASRHARRRRRPRRRASRSMPRPATCGSGSSMRDDHAADAGGDEGVGARRGAAVVRARLEGDPGGGAREACVAGRRQGRRLGVRAADGLGGALEHGAVGRLDHAADPRVRRRRRPHGRGELEGSVPCARVSAAAVMSSPGPAGPRVGTTTATDQGRPRSVLAPIRTLTVGSGISPDRPPHWP